MRVLTVGQTGSNATLCLQLKIIPLERENTFKRYTRWSILSEQLRHLHNLCSQKAQCPPNQLTQSWYSQDNDV